MSRNERPRTLSICTYFVQMYMRVHVPIHACKGRAISYIINMYMYVRIHVYVGHMERGRGPGGPAGMLSINVCWYVCIHICSHTSASSMTPAHLGGDEGRRGCDAGEKGDGLQQNVVRLQGLWGAVGSPGCSCTLARLAQFRSQIGQEEDTCSFLGRRFIVPITACVRPRALLPPPSKSFQ